MRRNIMLCLFGLSLVHFVGGFSLLDRKTSFVQFEPLQQNADGNIAVGFRCKTYVKAGLLFYADDEGHSEYLTLFLRDGVLVLELSDGKGKVFTADSKVMINDMKWHRIEVRLSSYHAVYRLDNKTQAQFNITKLQLKSSVFIGGFPKNIDQFIVSHLQLYFQFHSLRFLGCIEDLQLGNSTAQNRVLSSSGMSQECGDACKPENPCKNNGVCINKFATAECLCAQTGYYGDTCGEELPIIGISSADHRVTFDVLSSAIVNRPLTTSILVRVRSSQPDGVFFYTAHAGDYVLLELTNGRIAATVNLGSGSVTIATKKNSYFDNQWHRVELKRERRLVNLTVDNLDTTKGKTRGVYDKFNLASKKTSFVLGGIAKDFRVRLKSVSGRNFTGCLQDLRFNNYDLFGEFNKSAKEIVSHGEIIRSCPKTPTTATPNITTTVQSLSHKTDKSTLKSTKPLDVSSLSLITTSETTTVTSSRSSRFQSEALKTTNSSPTTWKLRVSTDDQSRTSLMKTTQSLVSSRHSTDTIPTSQHFSTKKVEAATKKTVLTTRKMTEENILFDTTGGVKVAKRNERDEGDLTMYFILAAVVGLVAFLLALLIIVKISSASKKKYALKKQKRERDYWADTGSFQRAPKENKPLV
ncbi:neurexin-3-like [Dendronephthya gigantea]|uniref:neurexin-3-like n=1 Tax=Dendronephthya gigantea TaxID=151771 RepID=UPI0010693234|nr:neurexin-3-like [Dendronephthya gigantea]